jgi:probable HAF family extracellular repeat protein
MELIMRSLRHLFVITAYRPFSFAVLIVVCVAACQSAIAQSCQFINLGTLPGSSDSYAFAINNRGQVVGYATMISTGLSRAFFCTTEVK